LPQAISASIESRPRNLEVGQCAAVVVGNWKMHGSRAENARLIEELGLITA